MTDLPSRMRAEGTPELKPCPHCGARLERSDFHSHRTSPAFYHANDEDDDADPCIHAGTIIRGAGHIAQWNRRAPDQAEKAAAYRRGIEAAAGVADDSVNYHGWISQSSQAREAAERIATAIRALPDEEQK